MSDVIIGVLENIAEKQTSYGVMFDVFVNGQKFGAGKVKPKFEKGDCIKFKVSRNGQWANVVPGSMEKHEGAAPTASTPLVETLGKPATNNTVSRTYEEKESDRQRSILFQSARKDAIEVAKLMVQAECIGFKSTSKWAEKHDIVMAKINDLTRTFYHQAVNHAEWVGNALPKIEKEEMGE